MAGIRVRLGLLALAGTLVLMAAAATAAHAALEPFHSESGFISLSVDAAGINDPAGTTIEVQKNAGATVRKAFLFAASTGFSGYTPVDGDVTVDGAPVTWDSSKTIGNSIGSINVASDVTALVKPKVDAAPAGAVSFTVAEPNNTFQIEGEVLAVILNDPTVTRSGTVILLYGAQQTTGDTFNVALADPVNKSDPNFGLNLSLGISYGAQPSSQFSTVDVNSTRMTSSAGGQDDGELANGALITAGGIGDLNDNPPDPNATTCAEAPRCDDELYNLLPFVNNGDTSLTFTTLNPSNDDNILFAALDVRGGGAVVGRGVVLSPTQATNPVGTPHTLTATVQDDNGNPIAGVTVQFQVTSGPNTGVNGSAVTGADGKAQFSYTSATAGTDTIVASFTDTQGTHTSNEVTKTWTGGPPPGEACKVTNGGRITAANGDRASFGGNAHPGTPPGGQEQYMSRGATPIRVHSINVESISCSTDRTQATITGKAKINGRGSFDYQIDVKDLGEPGRSTDTYRIRLSNGYDSGEQTLKGGNIQIHKK